MKILYITTIGGTMKFFNSFIEELLSKGHTVDIATNETTSKVPEFYREKECKIYHIDTSRSPLSPGNIKAIVQIKRIADKGDYDIIHCHTPLAAMCTRLACIRARRKGTKVLYTAHGFHFYKGASLKNWLIYYPVEWICSFFTDVLITINKEDYHLAKRHMHAKKVVYVPGVGIDTNKFKNGNGDKIRKELGIDENELMLLSVGELNENKNHETVIRALSKMKKPPVYVVVGNGNLKEHLQSLADELGVKLVLTGYRSDVVDFYHAADIYCLPSIREGLNVSIMEAMASGLPVVCSKIRGNRDMIDAEKGGYLCTSTNADTFAKAFGILKDKNTREYYGAHNILKVEGFSVNIVNKRMSKIYSYVSRNI